MVSHLGKSPCGRLVPILGGHQAYVPDPIPRNVDLSSSLIYQLDQATAAVANLAGVGETVDNPRLLIRPFLRREAVLSSRIEGTQASISDLYLYEASGERHSMGDVREVFNYVSALEFGLQQLEAFPISLRLINNMHSILMKDVRGADMRPGQLRESQVWIASDGGTSIAEAQFVPPPANELSSLLYDWEKFINEDIEVPPLVQCALMHYQFEAIHPYLDGNGRIGRLLIVLFLCSKKVLPTPLLYLSAYFERSRSAYYRQLYNVSLTGNWNDWLSYFLTGVREQARDSLLRARKVRKLKEDQESRLHDFHETGNAIRLLNEMFANPYMEASTAASVLSITHAGARGILDRLTNLGFLEFHGQAWPRYWINRPLLDAIQEPLTPE